MDQFAATAAVIGGFVNLPAKDDFYCALSAHHRNLGCGPRHYTVGPEIFTTHADVGAAISFAKDDGELGNGCGRVGEQHLCAVTNDAAVLLLDARQKSGRIYERNQRNVECVAVAHEGRNFVGGVDVEDASQRIRLVCDHTNALALNAAESDDHVRGEPWL